MTFRIKYDWQFRDEHYTSVYPAETDEENNIFKICGKNERGKTTTLKIIAFAFRDNDDDSGNINQGILEEISDLEGDETKLTFEFIIKSPDNKLTLECSYHDNERYFKINGNDVGITEVKEKFIVLFDVPEPLQEKLKNSIINVKNRFKRYIDLVSSYSDDLQKLYEQLTDYNNAEKKKKGINDTISNLESEISNYKKLLSTYTDQESGIRKEFVNYQYEKLSNEFFEADKRCKEIDNIIRKNQNRVKKTSSNGRNLLNEGNELRDMIYFSKELFIAKMDKDQRDKFNKILKDITSLSDLDKLDEHVLSEIYVFYLNKKNDAEKSRTGDVSDRNYKNKQELELIRKLLIVVKDYVNIDPEIPGAGKKVTELLTPLQQRERELSDLVGDDDTMDAIISKCEEIIKKTGKVTTELREFNEHRGDHEEEVGKIDLESLKKEIKEWDKKRDYASVELTKLESEYNLIPEDERRNFRIDPNIVQKYNALISGKGDMIEKIARTDTNIRVQKESLNKYEDLKKPNTEMSLDDIKTENNKVNQLLKKLNNYSKKLQNIDLKKMQLRDSSGGDGTELYSKIGEYLASVVEVIYHNKRPYEIKNIDFSRGEYILADGSDPIKFNWLGTGARALNALLAKIKQNFKGRKKIILIDEIGDMDSDNQQILLDQLKMQVKTEDTLLAMLTERDDSSDAVRMVPIPLD
jgi:hypothetical protein